MKSSIPELKRHGPGRNDSFSEEYKEDAVKLYAGGKTMAEVQMLLAEKHPDVPTPSVQSIGRWVDAFRDEGRRIVLTDDPTNLWQELELAALVKLIEALRNGEIKPHQLPIVAGIAADKRLKSRELDTGKTTNIRIHQLIEDRRKQLVIETAKQPTQPALEAKYKVIDGNEG